VTLKTTGQGGNYVRAVNINELSATASIFATALANNASLDELQTMADDQSKRGCLATNLHATIAVQTFVHYLRTLRLCTARFLPNPELLTRSCYGFDVQICCMQLAIQLEATQFGKSVVLEVTRESYFRSLSIDHFRVACNVNGMLDDFMVSWASGLDDKYITYRDVKIVPLKKAFDVLPSLRSVFLAAARADESLRQANQSGKLPDCYHGTSGP
jgi:hypothetical protein